MITELEAKTISLLRMHFNCSYLKLAMCCEMLFGADRCEEITGNRFGSSMGQGMVNVMEDYFKFERGQSDKYSMGEQVCAACGLLQVAVSPSGDAPKQCGHCLEMASMWL
jgi:hypothetical protein